MQFHKNLKVFFHFFRSETEGSTTNESEPPAPKQPPTLMDFAKAESSWPQAKNIDSYHH